MDGCYTFTERFDHSPSCDHVAAITGLASCSALKLAASSSLDGTVRVWDNTNKLLRYVHKSFSQSVKSL